MALSEEAKKKMYASQQRIHKETLDRLQVTFKKGEKDKYKLLAASRGMSLNGLIVSLLEQELKK